MKHLFCFLFLLALCSQAWAQRFVAAVPTLNDLLSYPPSNVQTNVFVAGRTAAGDGFEGFFTWNLGDTTTADTNSIFASTVAGAPTGRWRRVWSQQGLFLDNRRIKTITGTPEGVETDGPGALRLDRDGKLWLKASGTGNTGWSEIVAGGGTGDITAVGDVASGAAFDGTQGTTLTFNDADGDGVLTIANLSAARTYTLPDLTGTVALTANNLGVFAATTSAQLLGVISDETGTGLLVFGTSPTLTTPVISGAIVFPDGVRQTFNPDGTTPGFSVGSQAGDPSTPSNGDMWYDSGGNLLRARINGANVTLGASITINATDGYLPYRSSATAFSDSPVSRTDADSVLVAGDLSIGSLTNTLYRSGSNLRYTNAATSAFIMVDNDGVNDPVYFGHGTSNIGSIGIDNHALNVNGNGQSVVISTATVSPSPSGASLGTGQFPWGNFFLTSNIVWNGTTNSLFDTWGAGTPEGVVTARLGSIYRDTENGNIYKKASGTGNTGWSNLAAGSVGDVVGPASATDNAHVRFDGTTGKLVQDGKWVEADTGSMTVGDASQASLTQTFNLSGATDPVLTAANNSVTLNVPVLLPDGTTAAPGISFSGNTGHGMWRSGFNVGLSRNGVDSFSVSSLTGIEIPTAGVVAWSSTSSSFGTADLFLYRDAAATLQLGADAATATAQTLKAHDGSGTDKNGADITIAGGKPTGTGTPGKVKVAVTTTGTGSGSSLQSYTTAVALGGSLKVDTTTTGNVGAGEDDLISYTIPAGQLGSNGDYIEFDVFGTFAATANTARLKIFFDGAAFFDTTSLLFNGLAWKGHGKIIRTSATTQKINCEFTVGGTLLSAVNGTVTSYATDNATLSGTVVFKVTGEDTGGVPANDKVVQEGMVLKYYQGL